MSLDDVTPEEWDRVAKNKTAYGKLYHPEDKHDVVNKPDHYNKGAIEAIQAIRASMPDHEFRGYLKGNCLKYLWRYDYKGTPLQDLKKTQVYLGWLIKELENDL